MPYQVSKEFTRDGPTLVVGGITAARTSLETLRMCAHELLMGADRPVCSFVLHGPGLFIGSMGTPEKSRCA